MLLKIEALQHYDEEIRNQPNTRSYPTLESLARFRRSIIGAQDAEALIIE